MNLAGSVGSVKPGSWFFCKGFQVFTQGLQLCPLYKRVTASGALMLAGAVLIREAVHTFPIAALSPGEELRNNGETE